MDSVNAVTTLLLFFLSQ